MSGPQDHRHAGDPGLWVVLTDFGTNWANGVSLGFPDAAYRLHNDGTVELRGPVKVTFGVGGSTVFTLPTEARPLHVVQTPAVGLDGGGASPTVRTLTIGASGTAEFSGGAGASGDTFSLDGIRFATSP